MSYSKSDLAEFLAAYVEAALWSSTDESDDSGGRPLDENYDESDLAPDTRREMNKDCQSFLREAHPFLDESSGRGSGRGSVMTQAGIDFWLTRNGHGAGFWDGDWSDKIGRELTKISKSYGSVDLYVGDDGKIYST